MNYFSHLNDERGPQQRNLPLVFLYNSTDPKTPNTALQATGEHPTAHHHAAVGDVLKIQQKKNNKKSARSSSIIKSEFVDMLRNVRNLTEQGGHAGSRIRSSPSCNKRMLYRPYEVLMRPCLMRRECLATAARIHSVSAQSNKIPRDEEGRLGGESSSGGTMFKRSQIS